MGEYTNKVVGKTKKHVGDATDNKSLENEGRMQESIGQAQGGAKKAGRSVEDALDKVGANLAQKRRDKVGDRPERSRRDTDRDF